MKEHKGGHCSSLQGSVKMKRYDSWLRYYYVGCMKILYKHTDVADEDSTAYSYRKDI